MKIIIGERELKEGDAIERNKFSHWRWNWCDLLGKPT